MDEDNFKVSAKKKSSAVKTTVKPKTKPSLENNRIKSSSRRVQSVKTKEKSSSSVVVPPVGHRNTKKKKSTISPDAKYILIVSLIFVVIILFVTIYNVVSRSEVKADTPVATKTIEEKDELILEIKSGMSAREVASLLSGVVDSEALLSYLEENNLAQSLQVGTYRVPYGISIEQLAHSITYKDSKVTVYAGMTLSEIDRMLSNRGLIREGEFIASADDLTRGEGLSFSEGWFLSGSYSFTSAPLLAKEMHVSLLALLKDNAAAVSSSILSVNEIVILSSMINRETQDSEQMKLIAAVLLNRVKADQPLGVDATTRYELNDWSNKISQKQFDTITPYNTRRKKGFPPSGIGSPSAEALLAVLYPANSEALYYLHDESGALYTSLTYDEHLETYDKVH